MNDDDFDIFADSQNMSVSDNALGNVSALANELKKHEKRIAELEEETKAIKALKREIEIRKLPDAMAEAGIKDFTLEDGSKIVVTEVVEGSIPKDKETMAFAWLRANKAGDLIKNQVTMKFGRGDDKKVADIIKVLETTFQVKPEQKEAVAWNTLCAWAKEQLAQGKDLPLEILGLWHGRKAKVK